MLECKVNSCDEKFTTKRELKNHKLNVHSV